MWEVHLSNVAEAFLVVVRERQDGTVFLDFLHRAVVFTVQLRGDCLGFLDAEIVVVGRVGVVVIVACVVAGGVVGVAAVPVVGRVVMIVVDWLWIGGLVKMVEGIIVVVVVVVVVVVIDCLWNGKLAA